MEECGHCELVLVLQEDTACRLPSSVLLDELELQRYNAFISRF